MFDPLADADEWRLWSRCNEGQREGVADRFARLHADDVRDAVLEAQEADGTTEGLISPAAANAFFEQLWRDWIGYRDRTLGQMYRRGEIGG